MSPGRRAILALLILLPMAVAPVARGAEEPPPTLPVLDSGVGTLHFEGREAPLAYTVTTRGPLVNLATAVRLLGGELEVGALGEKHAVSLVDTVALLGPGSPAMTVGEEIIALSQPPLAAIDGLHVPIDVLERLYGESRRFRFAWDPAEKALRVTPEPLREIPVTLDLVHLQGVTTLVFQFPLAPHYQVRKEPGRVMIELAGDRIRLSGYDPGRHDPLVRSVSSEPQRISIAMAPDTVAENYVLNDPFRLVFDFYHRPAPAAGSRRLSPPRRTSGVHTIVLDPGHGGSDTGAVGPGGDAEKDLVLRLARNLQLRLEQRLPVKVVLTRNEDAELPLDTRSALANQQKADLFISLHLNSAPGARVHGAETYFLSLQASDSRAAETAAAENRGVDGASADGDPLYDLQLILWDLAQSRHLAESQELAKLIQDELNDALGLANRGVKQAPFRVLRGAAMPAVLVELGFLTNPEEEARLQSPAYRSQLVEALVRAVSRFMAQQGGARPPAERMP